MGSEGEETTQETEDDTSLEFDLSLDDVFPEDGEETILFSPDHKTAANFLQEPSSEGETSDTEEVMSWVDEEEEEVTDLNSLTSDSSSIDSEEMISTTSFMSASGRATSKDRFVRVSTDNLNRLMGLAGESLVEATALVPLSESFLNFKKSQLELSPLLEQLQVN